MRKWLHHFDPVQYGGLQTSTPEISRDDPACDHVPHQSWVEILPQRLLFFLSSLFCCDHAMQSVHLAILTSRSLGFHIWFTTHFGRSSAPIPNHFYYIFFSVAQHAPIPNFLNHPPQVSSYTPLLELGPTGRPVLKLSLFSPLLLNEFRKKS